MKILIEDSISSSDSESLFKWSDVVFPKEGRGFCWEKPSRHIVARANGLAVAHIGIGEYLVCGDREVRVLGAVIFVPLTFLAGIYGMNFENMPELASRSGYFVVIAVMFVIAVIQLFYFRKKRWI